MTTTNMATTKNTAGVIDFSGTNQEIEARHAPANIEAEQALLGAILTNNEQLQRVGDLLSEVHFYQPVHQRIFAAIRNYNDKGMIASPVTLKHYFEQDDDLSELGGGGYLMQLASSAIHVINIRDYADMICDLSIKRELINVGEDVVNTAYNLDIEAPASSQIEEAEQRLFNMSMDGGSDKGFRAIRDSVAEAVERAQRAYKNDGKIVGVDTGLRDLNEMLGGLQDSDLLILAGRPSMGKTALATNLAYNACLLYTSPSPRDQRGSRMPSSA